MAYDIHQLLEAMIENGASDLHLHVGRAPSLRVSGSVVSIEGAALTPEDTEALVQSITPPEQLERLKRDGGCDYGFSFHKKARFRVNVYRGKGVLGMVLRLIPAKMFTLEQLRLPPMIKDLLRRPRGLILVTGPTGSGKSTTLASMIDWLNQNEDGHIVTIEDPIEYTFKDEKSLFQQREIGLDVPSFDLAIKSVLRQNPDIILIGEMRDKETFETAISAAETGHLVISTMHASTVKQALTRLFEFFPPEQIEQARRQIAGSLRGFVCQKLIPAIEGGGRFAAHEILIADAMVSNLILDGQNEKIQQMLETNSDAGSKAFNKDIYRLIKEGKISKADGLRFSPNPQALEMNLKGIFFKS